MSENDVKIVTEQEKFLTADAVKLIDSHIFTRIIGAVTIISALGALGLYSFISNMEFRLEQRLEERIFNNLQSRMDISTEQLKYEYVSQLSDLRDREIEVRISIAEAEIKAQDAIDIANKVIRRAKLNANSDRKAPVITSPPIDELTGQNADPEELEEDPIKKAACLDGSAELQLANRTQELFDRSSRCRVHRTFGWTAAEGTFFLNTPSNQYTAYQERGTFVKTENVIPHHEDVSVNGVPQMLKSLSVRAHADGGSGLSKKRCGTRITLNLKQYPLHCAKYIVSENEN